MKIEAAKYVLWHKGEFLLLRRSNTVRRYPGAWNYPGGKVDPGESFREAGARELFEEAGILLPTREIEILNFHHAFLTHDRVEVRTFYAKCNVRPEVKINEESSEYMWATHKKIISLHERELCTPTTLAATEQFLDNQTAAAGTAL